MKICFITNRMNSGGIARTISTLANSFCVDNEITVLLAYGSKVDSFYNLDGRVQLISLNHKHKYFGRIKALKKRLLSLNPDVVISFHFNDSFFVSLSLKKNKHIKHIACERNDPNRVPTSALKRLMRNYGFKHANACCFQTQGAADYFKKRKNLSNSLVIRNPINLTNNPSSTKKWINNTIFTVGRLEKQKNYPNLLKAFSLVKEKNNLLTLKIYGIGSLENELKNLCRELNIQESVSFLGESKTWHKDEENSTLFVLASDYEGMPNALAEAMALGVPVVTTNATPGGPKELTENGKRGVLVEPKNSQLLADAIINVLDNLDYYRNIAISNMDMINNYSVSAYSNKWLLFIKDVVKKDE